MSSWSVRAIPNNCVIYGMCLDEPRPLLRDVISCIVLYTEWTMQLTQKRYTIEADHLFHVVLMRIGTCISIVYYISNTMKFGITQNTRM